MEISAQSILASQNEFGQRIDTMLVTFPRFILAELNTHRMLSKNSASSRAIPTHKLLKIIEENPFIPIAWQKEHKGMQGFEYYEGYDSSRLDSIWMESKDHNIRQVKKLIGLENGYEDNKATKQIANRLLEPFMRHTVLISGTEWENFFELRCPQYQSPVSTSIGFCRSWKDLVANHGNQENIDKLNAMNQIERLQLNKGQAEIHMVALAEAMWDARNEAKVQQLKAGEWHIPFGDKIDTSKIINAEHGTEGQLHQLKVKISTAMAARTSYTVVGDEREVSYQTLIGIHDKMAIARPFHASPFEHCARAMNEQEYELNIKGTLQWTGGQYDKPLPTDESEGWCRNYRGFVQYRHILESQA